MYTKEQINEISKNENVSKCSPASITYKGKFKVRAVRQYFNDGWSPNMIFREAGFDLDMIGRQRPKDYLKDWRKIYDEEGEEGLLKEKRGRPYGTKKKEFKDDKEKIEYLEAKIEYMDAENDFLAKLRGLERE